jgi:cytochrome P450
VRVADLLPLGATTLRPNLRAGRAFRRDPLAFMRQLPEHGGAVRFKVGFTHFVLVTSPELIHRVLFTDNDRFGEGKWTERGNYVMHDCLITREGQPHRERRDLLQPGFSQKRIGPTLGMMVEHAQRLSDSWRPGQRIDIRKQMGSVALTCAGEALFEEDLHGEADELVAALGVLLHAISRLPIPWPEVLAARRRLAGLARRMRSGFLVERMRAAGLSEAQIDDEIISLLIASVDTTPGTIAWIWFLMGRNPDVEQRVHAELDGVLGTEPVTMEALQRLPYLEAVLTEVLRLYPPVHFADRRALEEMTLGGVQLRAGDYLLISPLLTQRDARYYEDPELFRPDRWSGGLRQALPQYAFFPFGGGPHVCIGMGLARQEMLSVVATLAQRWRIRPEPTLPDYPSPNTGRLEGTLEERRACRCP